MAGFRYGVNRVEAILIRQPGINRDVMPEMNYLKDITFQMGIYKYDICCIGHITRDRINTPGKTLFLNGGTSYYFSYGINSLESINYKLVTILSSKDAAAVSDMKNCGIEVDMYESGDTVFFENNYGDSSDDRSQRLLAKSDPFTTGHVGNINARIIHLGSLLPDDFPEDVIRLVSEKAIVSVDAQGFLRKVCGDRIYPCEWKESVKILPYVDILKVNEVELESLTREKDIEAGARILSGYGVKEVVVTLGSRGSVVYDGSEYYDIPAYKPRVLTDATGCGDTYMAGYLYQRSKGASIYYSGCFAAAMATLKLEVSGPFKRPQQDVEYLLAANKVSL